MKRAQPYEPGGIFGEVEGRPSEEKPGRIIVDGVMNVVLRALEASRGPRGVRNRLFPGASRYSNRKVPAPADYRDGIAAAHRAMYAAAELVDRWVKGARGEGTSWEELADVLGIQGNPYFTTTSRGELAWRKHVTMHRHDRDLTFAEVQWRCTTCWEFVRDHGPGWHRGDPRQAESGHADDCARHAGEIAAWLAAHPEPDPSDQTTENRGDDIP